MYAGKTNQGFSGIMHNNFLDGVFRMACPGIGRISWSGPMKRAPPGVEPEALEDDIVEALASAPAGKSGSSAVTG
ncbi:hypothetical protein PoB_006535400 [Plakobranchus ocellatus]|uniref:Uncharacterized protein n=1 Tax=Plakobranchus ocellatus TaxID=259542 RepID=A0AAV4D3X5_9GAST|nr:hypothetical protein PoB_006535400 [Plakobranchus ocellatus]